MTSVADGRSAPSVFISYAHDTEEHKDDVRLLARVLEESGVAVELDQWAEGTRQDWSAWHIEQIRTAEFVVVVASPDYRRAGDGSGPPDRNRGIQSEAALLRDLLHSDRLRWVPKLLPVVLPGHRVDEIPLFLQPYSSDHYIVEEISPSGIESLLRVISAQPRRIRPDRGALPHLPPLPEQTGTASTTQAVAHLAEQWRPLPDPLPVRWRDSLVDLRWVQSAPMLELHIVPVDEVQRVQVRRLAELSEELADVGRARRFFSNAEQLDIHASDQDARVVAQSARGRANGLLVRRDGQRSAWAGLVDARIGWVLIQGHVARSVAALVDLLVLIDLPLTRRVALSIGIEPLGAVRIGTEADLTRSSASLPLTQPASIRVPAEESFTADFLKTSSADIAEEYASRLLAAFRRECR